MENSVVEVASDLSMWSLFWQADMVVKSVILALLCASIWCWAIIFEKFFRLRRLNAQASEFESSFWSGGAIDDLYDRMGAQPRDPMSAVFVAAMREWRRALARGGAEGRSSSFGLQERMDRVMHITASRELERVERYMTFLASTGSTAPFVGLFGTVWGIMNSFQSIGLTKNTSLAVVAPGIAEALFATALGLLAAIPAVLAYNMLSREIDRYSSRLMGFSEEFLAILSRQKEENP